MTSTVNRHTIPGEHFVLSLYRDGEWRLDDRELFGRTTKEDRDEIVNRLNAARNTPNLRQALTQAQVDGRIAHSYVWGILDTIRPAITQAQFEVFLAEMWNFGNEVEFAAFMYHAEKATGLYGYASAWRTFLRYRPQVAAILASVTVAARPL